MKKSLSYIFVLFFSLSFLFAGGQSDEMISEKKPAIRVASKIDTEGSLLGSMILLVLEDAGFETIDNTIFGPTDVTRRAIINGEIDIYPEYTGNGAFFFDQAGSEDWKDNQKGYEAVKELDYQANKLVWLTPAPANNTWAISVREDLAEREGLVTLEDLADYLKSGGEFKLAGSEEFISRPDALPAFEEAYGFDLTEDQMLVLSGGNTAQTEQAAARGTDGVNAAMAYGTDGQLAALGLVVLTDSLGVQPVYEPAPIIREEVLKSNPEIEELLGKVFSTLDLQTLQQLNSAIAVEGRPPKDVATEYLKSRGFL